MKTTSMAKAVSTIALGLLLALQVPQSHGQRAMHLSASTIPAAQLMQPEELNRILKGPRAARPLVLQVGSHVLFSEAHIAGSEYAGPGSSDEGLNLLRNRVKGLPRGAFIVLYCGCCPWSRCPNIAPAFNLLHTMGFTRVKVLYVADNFGTDWVNKGFAVAQGQ